MFINTPPRVRRHSGAQSPSYSEPTPAAPSSSPLTNMEAGVDGLRPLPTPLAVDTGLDHITCLERTVCSNYFCCDRQHPDLHALLEHFEEDHVIVLAPNGQRLYPPEVSPNVPKPAAPSPMATPTPSRSSSLITLSPTPSSSSIISGSLEPSSPSPPPSTPTFVRSRKPSLDLPPVYTPFTPSLPVDPADPYGPEEIVDIVDPVYSYPLEMLPSSTASQSFELSPPELEPSSPSSSSTSGEDGDEDMSDATSGNSSPVDRPNTHTGPLQTFVYATDKIKPIAAIPKHVSFASDSSAAPSSSTRKSGPTQATSSAKPRGKYRTSAGNPSRKREKMYKCPRPRCTKAYLNPNGLKYHLEKGTCKLEDDVDTSDAAESSNEAQRRASSFGAGAGDADVQMLETRPQNGGEGALGHDQATPRATAASFPPSDSNAPAPSSLPLTINYIDIASTSTTPLQHHRHSQDQGQGQGDVTSTSALAPSSSSGAGAAGVITSPSSVSLAPGQRAVGLKGSTSSSNVQRDVQETAQAPSSQHPAPIYHYPIPTYAQPSFLGGAGTAPIAHYATSPYYHRPYYASAPTSHNSGSGVDGALYPSSSSGLAHAPAAQPPMPLAISSPSMQ